MKVHHALALLPFAVAACGPDSGFNHLGCRNEMYADPTVRAQIAASAAPDTDPAVQRVKQAAYDRCTANLNPYWDPGDRGSVWRNP